jgi:GNAT superfamily N-acetyltransferase
MHAVSVTVERNPDQATKRTVQNGLFDANVQSTGDGMFGSVFVAARDSSSTVVGGVIGEAYWGWVNFTTVWVDPAHRRRGLASQMLVAAEAEAVRMGYSQACLDTFSFQCPNLYLRSGYEVFGQLEGFPEGSTRLFMRKPLVVLGAGDSQANEPSDAKPLLERTATGLALGPLPGVVHQRRLA